MAQNLVASQYELICGMILSEELATTEVWSCGKHLIKSIRLDIRYFSTTKASLDGGGHLRSITPPAPEATYEHPLAPPLYCMYLDKIMGFL
jgi:hypothetical protein